MTATDLGGNTTAGKKGGVQGVIGCGKEGSINSSRRDTIRVGGGLERGDLRYAAAPLPRPARFEGGGGSQALARLPLNSLRRKRKPSGTWGEFLGGGGFLVGVEGQCRPK